jgi:exonuclease VII small subunit
MGNMELEQILASPKFQVSKVLLEEIKSYLEVGVIPVLDWNAPESIRSCQSILATMEARLDRIVSINHDAKRILQRLNQAVSATKMDLMISGDVTSKMSGPQVDRELESRLPSLYTILRRWELVTELCQDAQKRLATAKDTIQLMSRLDDNLRWAASRNL